VTAKLKSEQMTRRAAKDNIELRNQNDRLVDTIRIHHENFDELHAAASRNLIASSSAHRAFAAYVWQMTHPDPAQRGPGD
jgi:hypothetical protein